MDLIFIFSIIWTVIIFAAIIFFFINDFKRCPVDGSDIAAIVFSVFDFLVLVMLMFLYYFDYMNSFSYFCISLYFVFSFAVEVHNFFRR